jgi:hypothetical protein
MHILRPIPVDRSAGPSTSEGTGGTEHPSDNVQEHDSEEEIHDHATGEDYNTMAAVEIRKSGNESTNSEEDDTSEDEETSKEDDDGDGEEPSGITLHSESTHRTGGTSIDASDGSYRPSRPSGPRQSSEEPATTTEGQGQEQEHDGTEGREAEERGN